MSNYNGFTSDSEPTPDLTPLEAYLTRTHGNLHDVIPDLYAREGTLDGVAAALSDDMQSVSYGWVHRWLMRNGYTRVSRWERGA